MGGWRTGERPGDVPTQPSGDGNDIPDIYLIIFFLCLVGMGIICVATGGS